MYCSVLATSCSEEGGGEPGEDGRGLERVVTAARAQDGDGEPVPERRGAGSREAGAGALWPIPVGWSCLRGTYGTDYEGAPPMRGHSASRGRAPGGRRCTSALRERAYDISTCRYRTDGEKQVGQACVGGHDYPGNHRSRHRWVLQRRRHIRHRAGRDPAAGALSLLLRPGQSHRAQAGRAAGQ